MQSWKVLSVLLPVAFHAACSGSVTIEDGTGQGGAGAAGSGASTTVGTSNGTTVGTSNGTTVGTSTGATTVGTSTGATTVGTSTGATTVGTSTGATTVGTGPGTTVSTGQSSSSGGPICDNMGDCDACQSCAWNGPCVQYADACKLNSECAAILICYQGCAPGDTMCFNDCYDNHPQGHVDYTKLAICILCNQCYNDCDSSTVGCP